MTAIYIILIAFALIAVLSFSSIKLRIIYNGELECCVRFLFLNFRLTPRKKKSIRLKNYSQASLRKKRKASQKKKDKADKKSGGKEIKDAEQPKPKKKKSISDILALIRYIKRIAFAALRKFGKNISLDIRRFVIDVGTGDAAKTAVMYGYISQAAAYLFVFFEEKFNINYKRNSVTNIACSFLAEKTTADIDITLRIRVWQIFDVAIAALKEILKKEKNKK